MHNKQNNVFVIFEKKKKQHRRLSAVLLLLLFIQLADGRSGGCFCGSSSLSAVHYKLITVNYQLSIDKGVVQLHVPVGGHIGIGQL